MSEQVVDDLINLHEAPPDLPASQESEQESLPADINLIDTDLPILEEKLQTASLNVPSQSEQDSRRTSIDIEDILITIDDDPNEDNFFDLCPEGHSLPKSLSCDNLEALMILENLDQVLNAHSDGEQDEETVEECLMDLDNYLKALEAQNNEPSSSEEPDISEEPSDESLRARLHLIEVNYAKFLASGCVNRAYVQSEPGSEVARPTTVAVIRRKRPQLTEANLRNSLSIKKKSTQALDLTWLHNLQVEQRQNQEVAQGTVVVEPPKPQEVSPASSSSWLRNSMRRLRVIRLPVEGEAVQGAEAPTQEAESARPVSAPSRLVQRSRSRSRESRRSEVSHEPAGRARSSSASSRSKRPRSLSSSESSLASSVDSSPSCTPTVAPSSVAPDIAATVTTPRRICDRRTHNDMPEADSPLGQWPHSLGSMMACLGCTLGLFNISRFAILSIHFGANFIFQFFLLSMVFGLPLFTLQLCLGQQLGAGVIDMWRISPLFQGVGVSLLVAQALMGLYSIVGVSWMFVFFRDAFITKFDKYRWAEPFIYYRNNQINGSFKLSETVPDYFSGVVLQRHHLSTGNAYGTIKFQLAFNLAVVWMIVFVSLSKGLRSYGKVIYVFTLVPVFGTIVLCAKILGLMPPEYVNLIFPETNWTEFFLNPKSWLAASQEVFLTWGLLGAAVMQIASHNKNKQLLQRDSSLVAVITFTVLLMVAFLANTCVQILKSYGYNYVPNSFEKIPYFSFLRPMDHPLPPNLANTPVRYMQHSSFILGERVGIPGTDPSAESGYQVLRFATELIPATFAALGSEHVSPFWAVLFYFILILFGIAQQLAIWHCVITGIMAIRAKVLKSWETTITFFSCACGFVFGLPLATELGIYVVYFMDYTIGGIWWLILVILLQIIAVFMVRGRPYSGDTVVTALFNHQNHPCVLSWAPPLLSFTWNVILPVGLMVLCITTFNNGRYSKEIFTWHQHHTIVEKYFPLAARQIGSLLQLLPILCVPLVAIIQSYRYLNSGPADILDRIQLLYRPPIGEHMEEINAPESTSATTSSSTGSAPVTTEDPPPKYTPPPSYTTATGARIAKFLRQSIRRSVRRIANVLGEGGSGLNARPQRANTTQAPPPDYSAVLVEMNNAIAGNNNNNEVTINVTDSSLRLSTLERLRNLEPSSSALTAAEVASILRSSFRRSTIRATPNVRNTNFSEVGIASLSAENLVDSAAPIGETSLVLEQGKSPVR